jgi:hypothetical protein
MNNFKDSINNSKKLANEARAAMARKKLINSK